MRKTVEILLVVLTALLFVTAFVSCRVKEMEAGKQAASSLSGAFSCAADIRLNGHAYTVNIVRLADGSSTVQFIRPDELSQLAFLSDKNGLRVRYGLMQTNLDSASVPQTAICKALLGAFGSAVENSTASRQGNNIVLQGKSDAGPFTLILDSEDHPKSLQMPRLNFAATIYDFTVS